MRGDGAQCLGSRYSVAIVVDAMTDLNAEAHDYGVEKISLDRCEQLRDVPQAEIQSRTQRVDSSALTACDGDYTRSIAAHPPLRVVPQLLYAERKQMEEAMGMLIIRHKVKDYGKWRPMFDEHSLMQKAAGLSNPRVFRSADDKSEIVVVFDTKDTKRAKDFAASPDLRETMAKAGVMDDPTIFFLESV